MKKRCYICSEYFKRDDPYFLCKCNVKVHEACAYDSVHCPNCDRLLIMITDPDETLGG